MLTFKLTLVLFVITVLTELILVKLELVITALPELKLLFIKLLTDILLDEILVINGETRFKLEIVVLRTVSLDTCKDATEILAIDILVNNKLDILALVKLLFVPDTFDTVSLVIIVLNKLEVPEAINPLVYILLAVMLLQLSVNKSDKLLQLIFVEFKFVETIDPELKFVNTTFPVVRLFVIKVFWQHYAEELAIIFDCPLLN